MTKFLSSPTFIAFRSAFLGALFGALQSAYEQNTLSFSHKSLVHMIVGALIAAGFSIWHLYLPSPNTPKS